jgi:hypothetical protein
MTDAQLTNVEGASGANGGNPGTDVNGSFTVTAF